MLGAKINEVRAVAKHVVDRDEHRVGDGHLGAFGPATTGEPTVARCEEVWMRPSGSHRSQSGFDEGRTEPWIAGAGGGPPPLAGALVCAGTNARPRCEVGGRGKSAHVGPDLGED